MQHRAIPRRGAGGLRFGHKADHPGHLVHRRPAEELLDARATRLRAEAQRYVAVYQVLATMGLLTVDHLQLGIPTYDPEAYYGAVEKAPSHSAQGKKLDRILEKIGD